MNERRLRELLLPCYIIFCHVRDDYNDRASRAIVNYLGKHLLLFCEGDKEKAAKVSKQVAKVVHEVNYFIADKDRVKGAKLVLVTFFLAQLIFDEKDGKIGKKEVEIAKITTRLIEFTTKILIKLESEDNIRAMMPSAEKQARKVYEKFYKKLN